MLPNCASTAAAKVFVLYACGCLCCLFPFVSFLTFFSLSFFLSLFSGVYHLLCTLPSLFLFSLSVRSPPYSTCTTSCTNPTTTTSATSPPATTTTSLHTSLSANSHSSQHQYCCPARLLLPKPPCHALPPARHPEQAR